MNREVVNKIPFSSVSQALAYYRFNNPVRLKSIDPHEPDKAAKTNKNVDLALFEATALAIHRVVKHLPADKKTVFMYCEIGRDGERIHPDYVAEAMRLPPKVIKKWLRTIRTDIRSELIRFGLLDEET